MNRITQADNGITVSVFLCGLCLCGLTSVFVLLVFFVFQILLHLKKILTLNLK